jgi:hypothetical protein
MKKYWFFWKVDQMGSTHRCFSNFALFYFRDIVIKREEDEPLRHKPHASGYLYLRHSLDIFHSFIVYFLWVERCHLHFGKINSNHKILQHVLPLSKLIFVIALRVPSYMSGLT